MSIWAVKKKPHFLQPIILRGLLVHFLTLNYLFDFSVILNALWQATHELIMLSTSFNISLLFAPGIFDASLSKL